MARARRLRAKRPLRGCSTEPTDTSIDTDSTPEPDGDTDIDGDAPECTFADPTGFSAIIKNIDLDAYRVACQ